ERVRMVLMQRGSFGLRGDLICGLFSTATVMSAPSRVSIGSAFVSFSSEPGPDAAEPSFLVLSRFRPRITSRLVSAGARLGVVPFAPLRENAGRFGRAPAVGLVFEKRSDVPQDRLDDAPGFLDIVLAGKQGGVALHGLAEQALVGGHQSAARVVAGQ